MDELKLSFHDAWLVMLLSEDDASWMRRAKPLG